MEQSWGWCPFQLCVPWACSHKWMLHKLPAPNEMELGPRASQACPWPLLNCHDSAGMQLRGASLLCMCGLLKYHVRPLKVLELEHMPMPYREQTSCS